MSTVVYLSFPTDQKDEMLQFINSFCAFHNAKRHPEGSEIEAHSAKILDHSKKNEEPCIAIPTHWNKEEHTIKTMADMFEFLEKNPELNIWERLEISGDML